MKRVAQKERKGKEDFRFSLIVISSFDTDVYSFINITTIYIYIYIYIDVVIPQRARAQKSNIDLTVIVLYA